MTTLLPLGNNAYSLDGFLTGAYILDVIVDMEGGRGIYETIIVILDKDQQPVQPTQIINKVKQITDVRIVFEEIEEEDDDCSNKPGSAKIGFPNEDKTECQLEEWNKCKEKPKRDWDNRCENIHEGFMDDDCLGLKNQKECDEAYGIIPICDENTKPGQLCKDEGDYDTCDEGYIDRGKVVNQKIQYVLHMKADAKVVTEIHLYSQMIQLNFQ
jgi:hypothetical protein